MKEKLKTTVGFIVVLACFFSRVQAETPVGKQLLGLVKNNEYVVTNEVDSVFTSWVNSNQVSFAANTNNFYIGGKSVAQLLKEKNEADPVFDRFQTSNYSLFLGNNAYAGNKGLAIGVPYEANWTYPFAGETRASDYSVALGDSAKALHIVSVAIGNQAVVGSLHTTTNGLQEYSLNLIDVTTTISNNVEKTSTNYYAGTVSYSADPQLYERFPRGDTETKFPYRPVIGQKVSGPTTNVNGSVTTITTRYEQKVYSLKDPSFVEPEYWPMYNRRISGGQGPQNLYDSIYGVAVGSRAYVFGYHSAAYGHYAHAIMPFSLALGSEAHTYAEGSHAIGYDTDIPRTSPYSLAIGANASIGAGMTNAIVIGVPQVVDFTNLTYRSNEGMVKDRPRAIKSNSINIVYHGEGIKDFYIDGKSLQDRLGTEVKVIGNSDKGGEVTSASVRGALGIDDGDHIVFATGGKIMLYTKSYVEGIDTEDVHLDEIVINGKTLAEILGSQTPTGGADTEFRTRVRDAATTAQGAVNSATNMVQVKQALNTFFETIKQ